jgi:hypothetical protein
MSKRIILAAILMAIFVIGIVAAGATGFYVASSTEDKMLASGNGETFSDPESEFVVAEESLDTTLFANASITSPKCTPITVTASFSNVLSSVGLTNRTSGKYEITEGQMKMTKAPDTIHQNGKRIILGRMPGVFADKEFIGEFNFSVGITKIFSQPNRLDPKYKKDRDLRTVSGMRLRIASQNNAEGTLSLFVFQRPGGKYFAELARYVNGNYKVIERISLTDYITSNIQDYRIMMNAKRGLKDNKVDSNVQFSITILKGDDQKVINFKKRELSGHIRLAGVIHRSTWQLSETSAYIDDINYSACVGDTIAPSSLEMMLDAEGLIEEELGE